MATFSDTEPLSYRDALRRLRHSDPRLPLLGFREELLVELKAGRLDQETFDRRFGWACSLFYGAQYQRARRRLRKRDPRSTRVDHGEVSRAADQARKGVCQ